MLAKRQSVLIWVPYNELLAPLSIRFYNPEKGIPSCVWILNENWSRTLSAMIKTDKKKFHRQSKR